MGLTNSTLNRGMTIHRKQINHKQYRQLANNPNCEIKNMFTVTPYYKLNDKELEGIRKKINLYYALDLNSTICL